MLKIYVIKHLIENAIALENNIKDSFYQSNLIFKILSCTLNHFQKSNKAVQTEFQI